MKNAVSLFLKKIENIRRGGGNRRIEIAIQCKYGRHSIGLGKVEKRKGVQHYRKRHVVKMNGIGDD